MSMRVMKRISARLRGARLKAGFAKASLACALNCIALVAPSFANDESKGSRPNIIWIMADDLGYGDLGCHGCKDIPTPHIDNMAMKGVKCSNFYAAAPVCTPSRASILSGRYPEAIGMTAVLMGRGGMASEVVTIAEVLKNSGYATGLIGKWHLGYPPHFSPIKSGYEEFFGPMSGGVDYFTHASNNGTHDLYLNDDEHAEEGYLTDLLSRRAVDYIQSKTTSAKAGKPFFLSLHYTAPHWPWETREDAHLAEQHHLVSPHRPQARGKTGKTPLL